MAVDLAPKDDPARLRPHVGDRRHDCCRRLSPGVAAGLVAAIGLFVVRYSRIDVVKHSLTAKEHQSNIERPSIEAEYLHEAGDSVLILELQGFIFFGTASRIIEHVKSHLERSEALRFVIFDFRLVTGVDSLAVVLLKGSLCSLRIRNWSCSSPG